MARYRIVHWKDIPSMVEAAEGDRTSRHQLSQKFQDLIDALAMREGATEGNAYLDGWAGPLARARRRSRRGRGCCREELEEVSRPSS